MITLKDSLLIVAAKLRLKKKLVFITLFFPGILFATLMIAAVLSQSIQSNVRLLTEKALNGQYLVQTTPVIPGEVKGYPYLYDKPSVELQARLEFLQKQAVEQRQRIAKQYGVDFSTISVESLYVDSPYIGSAGEKKINLRSPGWQAYLSSLQKEWVKTAPNGYDSLQRVGASYGAQGLSVNKSATISYATNTLLVDGKENLANLGMYTEPTQQFVTFYHATAVRNSDYSFIDQAYIQRFILPSNEKREQNPMAIPVVISYDEALVLFGSQLGLPDKPKDVREQRTWSQYIQNKVNGSTYQTCYRSPGEMALMAMIAKDLAEEALYKNKEGYVPPSVQRTLPTEACAAPRVVKDSRTSVEKQRDMAFELYQKQLGIYQPLERQLLTFQVVGLMNPEAPNSGLSTDLNALTTSILGARYDGGAFIPRQMYQTLPDQFQHRDVLQRQVVQNDSATSSDALFEQAGIQATIVSFRSAKDARAFMNNETCSIYTQPADCKRPWLAQAYGFNYLLIDELTASLNRVGAILFPLILGMSLLIIVSTMARLMIDSRRETAVFRALGATRGDIAGIYIMYSIITSLLIIAVAVLLSILGLWILGALYTSEVTEYVSIAYGFFDSSLNITLFSFPWLTLLIIAGLIIVVGFIALIPSLLRNVRRSPLRDMRDE